MKRAGWLLLVLAAAAAVGTASVRAADVPDAELAQIKKDIGTLIKSQADIAQQLKDIREQLDIVRIRCSS